MLGYWGKPERSRKAITQNPLHQAYYDPVYATGDIVRCEADGNFTFVARKDHMVKSRGYRIELGEIEHALYANQAVREAAVIALPDESELRAIGRKDGARCLAALRGERPLHRLTVDSKQPQARFCVTAVRGIARDRHDGHAAVRRHYRAAQALKLPQHIGRQPRWILRQACEGNQQ